MKATLKPLRHALLGPLLALSLLPAATCRAGCLPPIKTVFIIMMENTTWMDIRGSSNAPFINNVLLPMASHCESYNNVPGIHPSLPNYLWIEAGTNFGIVDDNDPIYDHQNSTNHLATLLNNAGIAWRAYQENVSGTSIPLVTCCGYSCRHNPFLYFDDVTGTNNPTYPYGVAHIRPYSELAADLTNNTVARYNFIVPSDCNDMHSDCAPLNNRILQGDNWLASELPKILSSAAYSNNGALFIAWDECYETDSRIGHIMVSPLARGGYACTNYYTHSSLLRTLQEIFGVGPMLGGAADAQNLSDLFTPLYFCNVERQTGGVVHLKIAGLAVGYTNILFASTDLSNWTPLCTNIACTNTLQITDSTATNCPRRFYQVVQLP